MKIAVLLAANFIFLLMVHHVSAQWDGVSAARESPVIEDNFPDKTFYVNQRLTDYWQISYPCKVTKGKPTPKVYWQWFLNNIYEGKIDSTSGDRVLNGTHLSLKRISPHERYQCVAENIYGTALSKKIHILESRTAEFNIKIKDNPYSVTKTVGDALVMECNMLENGEPAGDYHWATDKRVIEDDRVYTNEKGSLVFSYVKSTDANTYICYNTNTNKFVTTSGGWTKLEVNPRPSGSLDTTPIELLYNTQNGSTAMFGSKFIIQCMYGGKPVPQVEWQTPVAMNDDKKPTLVINNVTEKHEGCYKCRASNDGKPTSFTTICINVIGPPIWVQKLSPQVTVAEGSDVDFLCKARSLKGEKQLQRPQWMRNGKDLGIFPGEKKGRLTLSFDGFTLSFLDVRKSTDICNFQCSYSNKYGEIFADVSFNVILRTEILVAPENQVISRGDVAIFPIEFKVDPLVKGDTTLTWKLDGNKIETFAMIDIRILANWTLIVNTSQMDEDRFETFLGNYSITIDNGVETVIKYALLKQNPATGGTTMQSAGLDAKWIALIVALVLFFIIFILLLCILFNRQSGDDYSVDKKERKAGHDPEKELADGGFHDLPRTDDDPGLKKPDNLSISSTGKSIASDTDSMGEYSDNDAGSRFNEDGSFIGAYQSHESKGNESNV